MLRAATAMLFILNISPYCPYYVLHFRNTALTGRPNHLYPWVQRDKYLVLLCMLDDPCGALLGEEDLKYMHNMATPMGLKHKTIGTRVEHLNHWATPVHLTFHFGF